MDDESEGAVEWAACWRNQGRAGKHRHQRTGGNIVAAGIAHDTGAPYSDYERCSLM